MPRQAKGEAKAEEPSTPSDLPPLSILKHGLRLYPAALQVKGASSKSSPLRLQQLDESLSSLVSSAKPGDKDTLASKETLVQVLDWKLARGKFRPTLPKLVASNDVHTVKKCLQDAHDKISGCTTSEKALASGAMEKMVELKGIGPATASAYLSFASTSLPFFSDEAASFFPSLLPLKYTLPQYKSFVKLMAAALDEVNAQGADWTFRELEKALYAVVILRKAGRGAELEGEASEPLQAEPPSSTKVRAKRSSAGADEVEEPSKKKRSK